MAHKVTFSAPASTKVEGADIVFVVNTGPEKLGELHVSKGQVAWKPKNGKDSYKFNWRTFDQVAVANGRKQSGT